MKTYSRRLWDGNNLWAFNATEGVLLYKQDDTLMVRYFTIAPDGEVNRGHQFLVPSYERELRALWEDRRSAGKASLVTTYGKGYSGGHNTALREGWRTYHSDPEKAAALYIQGCREGHCTGSQPWTQSLCPENV